MPRLLRIVLVVLPLCAAGAAAAQTTGAISGRVTEPSGAAVAGADVEATSPSLQGARAVRSDRDGRYRLSALPPGDYRVVVRVASLPAGDLAVTVALGATASADFVLRMTASEEVVVSGGAAPIDLTSTGPTAGYPANIYDPAVPTNNAELYGKFTSRQAPRSFRAAVRVSF